MGSGKKQWYGNIAGLEHYGSPDDVRWSTVRTLGPGLYQVVMRFRGGRSSVEVVTTATLEDARARGEAWANTGAA